ncbi:hypothetical protein SDC9_37637 [bioreactor metagenome]|uniref:Uncharacterized protein n=1 Tax=bioreactor metagenome TaxID=1076179 RepID=A0A644VLN7_9ZZZZ
MVHRGRQLGRGDEGDAIGGLVEEAGGGKLFLEAGLIGARGGPHGGARGGALGRVGLHQRHGVIPDPRKGLAEIGVLRQHPGVRHHHVDDLARDLRAVEDDMGIGQLGDFRHHRVPGDHRGHVRGLEGADHVRIGGVDDLDVLLGHAGAFEPAHQQVFRDREFDEVDALALDVGQAVLALQDHRVIAVREVADHHRGGVDAARGRDREPVHVGQRHRVIGAGGVLVHRLDIVVELGDLDCQAVFVGPFLHDAMVGGIAPGHPAGIDRPGDLEVGLRGGEGGRDGEGGQGCERAEKGGAAGRHGSFLSRSNCIHEGTNGPSFRQSLGWTRSPGFLSRRAPNGDVSPAGGSSRTRRISAGTLAANSGPMTPSRVVGVKAFAPGAAARRGRSVRCPSARRYFRRAGKNAAAPAWAGRDSPGRSVEVAAWEQPFRLLARVAGARRHAAGAGGVVRLGPGQPDHGVERMAKRGQPRRQVLDRLGDQVHDAALALEPAAHPQQPPADHRAAEAGIDGAPDHHIRGAGLVLEGEEDHPRGGAGALSGDDEAAHRDPLRRRGGKLDRGAQPRDPGPQQLHRMGAQRQAQRDVILDHLLAQMHRRQLDRGLGPALAIERVGKERQRRRRPDRPHRPERIAPRQPHAGEGVGLGQTLERGGAGAGAQPQAFGVGIAVAAGGDDPLGLFRAKAADLPEAEPQRQPAVAAPLEAVVPARVVDADRPHLDPVLAQVAHDLGGGVKPHRLAVQQRAGEDRRVVAFQPGRDIGQHREGGGMAFGETVIGKALDLRETGLGHLARIAVRLHPADEAGVMGADRAHAAERGERAAQLVGLLGGIAGADHRDLHRLLLKQRHAKGLCRDRGQRRAEGLGRLEPLTAADIGFDHAALDRAGADDRHLDHQIVEGGGLHPRQEVHLRSAFDLEHPHGIGARQHPVGGAVLLRHGGKGKRGAAAGLGEQREGLAQAAEHAEAEHVDLQDAERVDVVLVPFDHRAPLHRRVLDRAQGVEPVAGDDEAADMLAQVARKADDLGDQRDGAGQAPVVGVQPELAQPGGVGPGVRAAPDLARERRGDIGREPHHLADLADRGAGAEMDDGGAQPRPLAAIAGIDPLDHLLAPLMLEIDVDVGRLAAVARDEAFEHHADHLGADIGDAERPADDRIRRRAAALTQDRAGAGEGDDVVDGEEIGRIAELADQSEFLAGKGVIALGDARGAAPGQTLVGQPFEPGLRRLAVLDLVGVLIAELAQIEGAARRDLQRAADRGGVAAEQPCHVGRALQPALGIRQGAGADRVDGDALAQAGEHIGERPARGAVHQHVTHGHHRRRGGERQRRAGIEPGLIGAVIARRGAGEDLPRKAALHPGQGGKCGARVGGRQRDQHEPRAAGKQIIKPERALALRCAPPAEGQKLRQPAPAGAVDWQGEPFDRAVGQHEPRPGDQPRQGDGGRGRAGRGGRQLLPRGGIDLARRAHRRLRLLAQHLQRGPGPHHARDRVAVGDRDRAEPELGRAHHQFLGVGGAGEEGEVRGDAKLGIGRGVGEGGGRGGAAPGACRRLPRGICGKEKARGQGGGGVGGRGFGARRRVGRSGGGRPGRGRGGHANSPCTHQPGSCGV